MENFPGFPKGINGYELTNNFREQSINCGAKIVTETVTSIDTTARPFKVCTDNTECLADTVIVCTGAVARRLEFPGSGEGEGGFWNKGISACAVCDGAAPMFRGKPIAVIGGGVHPVSAGSLPRPSREHLRHVVPSAYTPAHLPAPVANSTMGHVQVTRRWRRQTS